MKTRLYTLSLMAGLSLSLNAQVTPMSQMERLDRGTVVVPTSSTANFISWRLLGTDDKSVTTFDVIRNGETIASDLTKTNYQDSKGSATAQYQIVTKVNGEKTETSQAVSPWAKKFLTLKLDQPAKGAEGGTYTPNDMSVGDVDGDGQYELFVKWNPSNAHDNSEDGFTDNVILDCYKLDGTKLWRIDLGPNIRAGAHYTQFMVYDFDGDGRAEMMCKTAPGSKDGLGNYVNQAATDATIKGHENDKVYRVTSGSHPGHVLSGPEYLTVFSGATGEALHTTWYLPGRAGTGSKLPSGKESTEGGSELGKVSTFPSGFWGDNYGGRSERYLAAVAYINGADKNPCGIFSRGYYTQAYVWAVSFDGTRLHTEWLHASPNGISSIVFTPKGTTSIKIEVDGDVLVRQGMKTAPANTGGVTDTDSNGGIAGSNTLYGNGNHNLSIADVDGDGCDEILWGSAALDNDGTLLYATGYGHGDAIHVGKMIPDSTDLYVFDVHEEKLKAAHGSWDLHNARTGRIVHHGGSAESDNGRGMAAALSTSYRGYQFWSSDDRQPRSAISGNTVINKSCSVNYRIYWDGTYVDQLFDGNNPSGSTEANPYIQKWNGSSFTDVISFNSATYNYGQSCNTTKSTPCLQADILGDWREELILWNKNDPSEINIYTTWTATNYAVPTLMHDHVYRMGIAWQNTAYNQPPHLGYFLPDYIDGKLPNSINQTVAPTNQTTQTYDLQGRRTNGLKKGLNIMRVRTDKGVETRKVIY
jgi:rhamnogalacturonan endolyase